MMAFVGPTVTTTSRRGTASAVYNLSSARHVLRTTPVRKGKSARLSQCRFSYVRMESSGEGRVPIDLPSGVLLAVSSVLAIAAVGCVFELSSGHPQYGVPLTSGILIVSLPGFLGLFYAAIRKGQVEAEED